MALALVALAFGVLLVVPMLSHVSTNLSASQVVDQNMREQYASDAGVEYGIWKLENDAGFRDQVKAAGDAGVTLPPLPSRVNSLDPVVRVINVVPDFHYVIWGQGTSCDPTVELVGSRNVINGDVHTNWDLTIDGSGNIITGTVTYVHTKETGSTTFYPPDDNPAMTGPQEMPVTYDMSDYSDPTQEGTPAYAADQKGEYTHTVGSLVLGDHGAVLKGLYYVTGDIDLGASGMSGNVTVVSSNGKIVVVGDGSTYTAYCDQLILYTDLDLVNKRCKDPVITIDAGGISFGGVIYAPNGRIKVSGSSCGSFVGDSVYIEGSDLTMSSPTLLGFPAGCTTAYDILSDAGEFSTMARVVCCDGEEFEVVSWWIQ